MTEDEKKNDENGLVLFRNMPWTSCWVDNGRNFLAIKHVKMKTLLKLINTEPNNFWFSVFVAVIVAVILLTIYTN